MILYQLTSSGRSIPHGAEAQMYEGGGKKHRQFAAIPRCRGVGHFCYQPRRNMVICLSSSAHRHCWLALFLIDYA